MNLLGTVQGFAERRGVTYDPTDKKAIRALEDASAFIRTYTYQLFDAVTDDEITRDGTDRYGVLLPQLPVTAVSEVATIDEEGTATVLDAITYRADNYGMLWRLDGWVWDFGHANIAVTYDHGYATVPADIAAVCYDLAAENYISTGGGAVTSEQIGNYQVTYDAATVGGAELPDTTRYTLNRYRVCQ